MPFLAFPQSPLLPPAQPQLVLVRSEALCDTRSVASKLTSDSNSINTDHYNGQREAGFAAAASSSSSSLFACCFVYSLLFLLISFFFFFVFSFFFFSKTQSCGLEVAPKSTTKTALNWPNYLPASLFASRSFHLTRVCAGSKFGTFGFEAASKFELGNLELEFGFETGFELDFGFVSEFESPSAYLLPLLLPVALQACLQFPTTTLKLLSRSAYYYGQISTVYYPKLCLLLLSLALCRPTLGLDVFFARSCCCCYCQLPIRAYDASLPALKSIQRDSNSTTTKMLLALSRALNFRV